MPTVPQYSSQVQEQALPNVRVPTDVSVDTFGGGASLDRVTQAAAGAADTWGKYFEKQKEHADDVAVKAKYSPFTQGVNDLLYNPNDGAYAQKGKNAFGIVDDYGKRFDDLAGGLEADLNSDDQRAMFRAMRDQKKTAFIDGLQRHTFTEAQKYDEQTTDGVVATSRDDAVLNYQDPGAVEKNLAIQRAAIQSHADQNGLPAEMVKARLEDVQSKTLSAVIQRMIVNGQDKDASDYYSQVKDRVSSEDSVRVEKELEGAKVLGQGISAYAQVKNFKLPDGSPDEAKMRDQVNALPGLSDENREKVWSYVKARTGEDISNAARADASSDREFMNQALAARKSNVPLTDALKLVPQYGKDDYDQSLKAQAIQKIYAPPTESDPGSYITTWEKVQDGKASKNDIDQLMTSGRINVSDWRKLREDYYRVNTVGADPMEKSAWARVKSLADAQLGSDKQSKDAFMYEVRTLGEGKSPEEIWKIANDKLKGDPNTGIFGLFKKAQYSTDVQRMDANNLSWGKVYEDVGKDQAVAIGQGALYSGKKTWGLGDVDSFAAGFGGYDNIKAGTPTNNAIQSLVKKNQLATPANVKAVLQRYPDGKF